MSKSKFIPKSPLASGLNASVEAIIVVGVLVGLLLGGLVGNIWMGLIAIVVFSLVGLSFKIMAHIIEACDKYINS